MAGGEVRSPRRPDRLRVSASPRRAADRPPAAAPAERSADAECRVVLEFGNTGQRPGSEDEEAHPPDAFVRIFRADRGYQCVWPEAGDTAAWLDRVEFEMLDAPPSAEGPAAPVLRRRDVVPAPGPFVAPATHPHCRMTVHWHSSLPLLPVTLRHAVHAGVALASRRVSVVLPRRAGAALPPAAQAAEEAPPPPPPEAGGGADDAAPQRAAVEVTSRVIPACVSVGAEELFGDGAEAAAVAQEWRLSRCSVELLWHTEASMAHAHLLQRRCAALELSAARSSTVGGANVETARGDGGSPRDSPRQSQSSYPAVAVLLSCHPATAERVASPPRPAVSAAEQSEALADSARDTTANTPSPRSRQKLRSGDFRVLPDMAALALAMEARPPSLHPKQKLRPGDFREQPDEAMETRPLSPSPRSKRKLRPGDFRVTPRPDAASVEL